MAITSPLYLLHFRSFLALAFILGRARRPHGLVAGGDPLVTKRSRSMAYLARTRA